MGKTKEPASVKFRSLAAIPLPKQKPLSLAEAIRRTYSTAKMVKQVTSSPVSVSIRDKDGRIDYRFPTLASQKEFYESVHRGFTVTNKRRAEDQRKERRRKQAQ